jgi:5-formyltetrahydrofolate cyclo-ligase
VLRAEPTWFAGKRLGFYWPMKGEPDLLPFVRSMLPALAAAALPVVVERRQPLEFWRWTADTELSNRGVWNIPQPATRDVVAPDVLLVPLVGFDPQGFRLGYGGGYYDRTLARLAPRPLLIGVGYEQGRLATIRPQPHDIPLDIVITENGRVDLMRR